MFVDYSPAEKEKRTKNYELTIKTKPNWSLGNISNMPHFVTLTHTKTKRAVKICTFYKTVTATRVKYENVKISEIWKKIPKKRRYFYERLVKELLKLTYNMKTIVIMSKHDAIVEPLINSGFEIDVSAKGLSVADVIYRGTLHLKNT